MRGCLFVVFFAAAVLGVGAWFLAPPVAEALVGGSLRASGFEAQSSTLTIRANPPLRLLAGHADRLTLDAQGVTWRRVTASRLGLELDGVDLFGRTAATVHGRFDGVAIDDGQGSSPAGAAVATITFDGPADGAAATIEVDRDSVRNLVTAAVSRAFNVRLSDVELAAPDRLRLTVAGTSIEGSVTVDGDRGLALSTRLGQVRIVTIDPSLPLRLRSVAVDAATLRVRGVLDVAGLLGGGGPD